VVERARIVLLAGEGVPGKQIAARVGCAEPTVVTWRGRYAEQGLAGLEDLPRPGSPSPLPEALRDRVLGLTLTEPPTRFGATHWSSRLLATALAGEGTPISPATIARIWHRFGVQPWRAETFKFSTDPELEGKIRDVVGLYLHPPEKAVVLCVDEKPQVQALERTAPTLPVRPGQPEAASFDYVRHGTTTLFAAREVATGKVTDACTERHRHQEFLGFLQQVAAAYPRRQLHVVVDNLATHKHPAVRAWLASHRRVRLHFTPTSGSWLNLVEAFFSILTRQALRRGSSPSVPTWSPRSSGSSTPGTTAAHRSPGPRTPARSSPRPPILAAGRHKRRQIRTTSGAALDSGERCRSRAGRGMEPQRLPAVLRSHGPTPR
jgi:transposase